MPEWGYSTTELDPTKTAKASGRELRVSPKHATEICKTIKGMKLQQAKIYLNQVIQKKAAIPFRKHKKKIPHMSKNPQQQEASPQNITALSHIQQFIFTQKKTTPDQNNRAPPRPSYTRLCLSSSIEAVSQTHTQSG